MMTARRDSTDDICEPLGPDDAPAVERALHALVERYLCEGGSVGLGNFDRRSLEVALPVATAIAHSYLAMSEPRHHPLCDQSIPTDEDLKKSTGVTCSFSLELGRTIWATYVLDALVGLKPCAGN